MYRSKKRSSIAMVMLMVVSLFAGMSFPNVSASEVAVSYTHLTLPTNREV